MSFPDSLLTCTDYEAVKMKTAAAADHIVAAAADQQDEHIFNT